MKKMVKFSGLKYVFSKALNILLQPAAKKNCSISKKARVCSGSRLTGVRVGEYSYIGHNNFCVNTDIGRFCSIADGCSIGGAAHPLEFVSTSPVFCNGKNVLKTNFAVHEFVTGKKTVIGNDVWIGMVAYIKSGVKIDNGAVIGMGSVVTKDVGPYEIWAGNPAKLIRTRFDAETTDKLCKLQWWQWKDERVMKYSKYFNDPYKFIREAEGE